MKVIVAGTLFSLVGSLNSLILSASISAAFSFLSPHCSRARASAVYQIAVTLVGSHNLLVTDGIWALY